MFRRTNRIPSYYYRLTGTSTQPKQISRIPLGRCSAAFISTDFWLQTSASKLSSVGGFRRLSIHVAGLSDPDCMSRESASLRLGLPNAELIGLRPKRLVMRARTPTDIRELVVVAGEY